MPVQPCRGLGTCPIGNQQPSQMSLLRDRAESRAGRQAWWFRWKHLWGPKECQGQLGTGPARGVVDTGMWLGGSSSHWEESTNGRQSVEGKTGLRDIHNKDTGIKAMEGGG